MVNAMKKRQFGTVRQLSSGRWQVRYRHPVSNRMMAAEETFATKGTATAWLDALRTDLGRGMTPAQVVGTDTLREYSERWLRERTLRPRSIELYQGLLTHYLLPDLGDLPLASLSPSMVRSWHAALVVAPKPGAVTVAKAYRLLHAICETAAADELILRNPCNVKGAATERSAERPVLTIAQLDRIVGAIEPRYVAMVIMAAWCGLRLGELLALTRRDLDLLHKTVRIDKSASELQSGERIIGPPKTAAGRRVVSIPPHIVAALEIHLATFSAPGRDGLVFVGEKQQAVRRGSLYTSWQRALKKAELQGYRFHDLRHTSATMAALTGASTRELMHRLGHSSSGAALRYQHLVGDRDTEIAKALSTLAKTPEEEGRPIPDENETGSAQ
jgi:integrase